MRYKKKRKKNNNFLKAAGAAIAFAVVAVILISYFQTSSYRYRSLRSENLSLSRSEYLFGIDISHYQGTIDWSEVSLSGHPIEFVFIRATMGKNGKDAHFALNWEKAKEYGYLRGAYHYYRPNENSTEQFNNFASTAELQTGDFPPLLDIEKTGIYGKENLQKGVLNWLKLAEKRYGIKPIVYTGRDFYQQNLKGYIDDYQLWIASYADDYQIDSIDWSFHQFTDRVIIRGIKENVDGNRFKGSLIDLNEICLTDSMVGQTPIQ